MVEQAVKNSYSQTNEENLRSLADRQRRIARIKRRQAQRQSVTPSAGKINNMTAILLLVVAGIIDLTVAIISLLHFIPAIGNVLAIIITSLINVFIWFTLYIWLKIKGVNLISPKKAAAMAGAGFLGFIPVLKALPNWTLAMAVVILLERKSAIPVVSRVPVGNKK